MNTHERKQAALDFIARNQRIVTVGPSLRELAAHLGVAVFAAQRHVMQLREEKAVGTDEGNGLVLARPKTQPHHEEPVKVRYAGDPFNRLTNVRPRGAPILKPSGRIA